MSFKETVCHAITQTGIALNRNAPVIMLVGGIIGVGVGVVLACKETTKAQEILEKKKEELAQIDEAKAAVSVEEYPEEAIKKDTMVVRIKTAGRFVKLYAPAAIVLIASLALIIGSHAIEHNRLTSAMSAYTALSQTFKEYRNGVKEHYGEEVDEELRYGKQVVDENGTKVAYVENNEDPHLSEHHYPDAVEFNRYTAPGLYQPNVTFLQSHLAQAQNYMNDKLMREGELTENEVRKWLTMKPTADGYFKVWRADAEHVSGNGQHRELFHFVIVPAETQFSEPYALLYFDTDGYIAAK